MIQKKRGRRKKRVCASCADKVTTIDLEDMFLREEKSFPEELQVTVQSIREL